MHVELEYNRLSTKPFQRCLKYTTSLSVTESCLPGLE